MAPASKIAKKEKPVSVQLYWHKGRLIKVVILNRSR